MSRELLIIFARNPELGKVKTRLAKTIGKLRALEVYRLLLERTHKVASATRADKVVYYADHIEQQDLWHPEEFQKAAQGSGDLGMRMLKAFNHGFQSDYSKVVIIGSDCYELTSELIQQAFEQLERVDVVIGPARDGGYYLLGLKELHSKLFINKKWSSPSVLRDTLNDVDRLGLKATLLPVLSDVDVEEDLISFKISKHQSPG